MSVCARVHACVCARMYMCLCAHRENGKNAENRWQNVPQRCMISIGEPQPLTGSLNRQTPHFIFHRTHHICSNVMLEVFFFQMVIRFFPVAVIQNIISHINIKFPQSGGVVLVHVMFVQVTVNMGGAHSGPRPLADPTCSLFRPCAFSFLRPPHFT